MIYRKRFEVRRFSMNAPEEEQQASFIEAVHDATDALLKKMRNAMEVTERLDFETFRIDVRRDLTNNNCSVSAYIATQRSMMATIAERLNDPTFQKALYDGTSNMDGVITQKGDEAE